MAFSTITNNNLESQTVRVERQDSRMPLVRRASDFACGPLDRSPCSVLSKQLFRHHSDLPKNSLREGKKSTFPPLFLDLESNVDNDLLEENARTKKDIKRLERSLDTMHMDLCKHQEQLVQLRISVIRAMLDFELATKEIQEYQEEERWDTESNEEDSAIVEVPAYTPQGTNHRFLRSPRQLRHNLHTIVEEGSPESESTESWPSMPRRQRSVDSTSGEIPLPTSVPFNSAPISTSCTTEPDSGRATLCRPSSPNSLIANPLNGFGKILK